jgi:hypothetical protein
MTEVHRTSFAQSFTEAFPELRTVVLFAIAKDVEENCYGLI